MSLENTIIFYLYFDMAATVHQSDSCFCADISDSFPGDCNTNLDLKTTQADAHHRDIDTVARSDPSRVKYLQ